MTSLQGISHDHCAILAHQQIVVLSFKGPTRLSEDTSANDHACSMS